MNAKSLAALTAALVAVAVVTVVVACSGLGNTNPPPADAPSVAGALNADGTISITVPLKGAAGAARNLSESDIKTGLTLDYFEVTFRTASTAPGSVDGYLYYTAAAWRDKESLTIRVPPADYDVLLIGGHANSRTLLASAYYTDAAAIAAYRAADALDWAGGSPPAYATTTNRDLVRDAYNAAHKFTVALGKANTCVLALHTIVVDPTDNAIGYKFSDHGSFGPWFSGATNGLPKQNPAPNAFRYVVLDKDETAVNVQWKLNGLQDLILAKANRPDQNFVSLTPFADGGDGTDAASPNTAPTPLLLTEVSATIAGTGIATKVGTPGTTIGAGGFALNGTEGLSFDFDFDTLYAPPHQDTTAQFWFDAGYKAFDAYNVPDTANSPLWYLRNGTNHMDLDVPHGSGGAIAIIFGVGDGDITIYTVED
jgi:hypothetical protein